MNDFWASAEVISTYSRKQAIEDGALKDITEAASNRGFPFAAAMTDAAWTEAVAWDEKNGGLQDEKGRLWDVVSMALGRGHYEPRTPRCGEQPRPVPPVSRAQRSGRHGGQRVGAADGYQRRRRRRAGHHDHAPPRGLARFPRPRRTQHLGRGCPTSPPHHTERHYP